MCFLFQVRCFFTQEVENANFLSMYLKACHEGPDNLKIRKVWGSGKSGKVNILIFVNVFSIYQSAFFFSIIKPVLSNRSKLLMLFNEQ